MSDRPMPRLRNDSSTSIMATHATVPNRQVVTVPAGRAVKLGEETSVGLQIEQPAPVGWNLVPAGLLFQPHAEVDVGDGHAANAEQWYSPHAGGIDQSTQRTIQTATVWGYTL